MKKCIHVYDNLKKHPNFGPSLLIEHFFLLAVAKIFEYLLCICEIVLKYFLNERTCICFKI